MLCLVLMGGERCRCHHGIKREESQQAMLFSAGVMKFSILGLSGDIYFVPLWLCYL